MAGTKTVYQTAKGKQIDLNKLINQNELTLAVGNKKVNARGDLIGPGGQIIKKTEDVMNGTVIPDHIRTQPQPAPLQEPTPEPEPTPVPETETPVKTKTKGAV